MRPMCQYLFSLLHSMCMEDPQTSLFFVHSAWAICMWFLGFLMSIAGTNTSLVSQLSLMPSLLQWGLISVMRLLWLAEQRRSKYLLKAEMDWRKKIEGFRWLLNEKQNIRKDKSPRMDINFVLDTQKNRNQLKLDVWPQPHNSLRMLFFSWLCLSTYFIKRKKKR